MEWLILVVILFFIGKKIYSNYRSKSQNDDTKAVMENLKNITDGKQEKIQNLFVDCAGFIQQYSALNNLEQTVFTAELVLHIYSLWYANKLSAVSNSKPDVENQVYEALGLKCYAVAIKYYLNLLIKESLHQKEIDIDTTIGLIKSRANLIFTETDFENRNNHFLNLCGYACKYESTSVFATGDLSKLPLLPNKPVCLMILPQAYHTGLVDKYMELL